jgi:glycosyltransferase involved in cell wall biosynthesis
MESTQNNQKKKVLFIITKSNWGGAQRYVFDLATNLPEEWEPVVALGGDGELKTRLEATGVRVVPIPGLVRDISLRRELLASFAIAKLIRDEDPDVLHVNSSKAGAIGTVLGRLLFVPRVVFTSHGWAFNEDRGFLSRFLIKCIHWLTVVTAHRTIAVSKALASQLTWLGAPKKMRVVYSGRSPITFHPRDEARVALSRLEPLLVPLQGDPWTISIGELHPVKQHHVAIEAIASLVARHPQLRHIIMGAGQAREELQTLVNTLKLERHVFFLGNVPEAAQYMKAADIFVFPSRSESFGFVALEAAQAAVPIVASNVGGVPEAMHDGTNGSLVPSGSVTALAGAIEQYLTDPALAHERGAAGPAFAEQFTIAKMVTETLSNYER